MTCLRKSKKWRKNFKLESSPSNFEFSKILQKFLNYPPQSHVQICATESVSQSSFLLISFTRCNCWFNSIPFKQSSSTSCLPVWQIPSLEEGRTLVPGLVRDNVLVIGWDPSKLCCISKFLVDSFKKWNSRQRPKAVVLESWALPVKGSHGHAHEQLDIRDHIISNG